MTHININNKELLCVQKKERILNFWWDQVELWDKLVYETQTFNRETLMKWITMLMFIATVMPIHLRNGHTHEMR